MATKIYQPITLRGLEDCRLVSVCVRLAGREGYGITFPSFSWSPLTFLFTSNDNQYYNESCSAQTKWRHSDHSSALRRRSFAKIYTVTQSGLQRMLRLIETSYFTPNCRHRRCKQSDGIFVLLVDSTLPIYIVLVVISHWASNYGLPQPHHEWLSRRRVLQNDWL